ncbi:copper resistance CopC family protein [Microbacterium sp. cx-59]|uniref:copper resistance CopC family protein n=1 Tax=Microbacterium sp. cx-59 TaxID=2891207 RepID=UPI001E611A81|nr:copper resistance CopC family protein [Microbacterium sp. cx-59]MCC4907637.1 copper resistance protein CopC [Microbacterium sp. cx-59]
MNASGTFSSARRLSAAVLAGLVLALGMLWASAVPASAHDELSSSDPAAGSTVDVLPAQLVLTFSAELLSDGSSTVIQVTDAAGSAVTDAAPVVEGTTVTQSLGGSATGTMTVLWRVVSSDGHPISGEYTFDVAAAPAPIASTPVASPSATATPSPATDAVAPAPSPSASVVPADPAGADPLPWIIGAVALVVVIGIVVWLLGARARQQKEVATERTAGRDVPRER